MDDWQIWVEAASGVITLVTAVLTLIQAIVGRRREAPTRRDGSNG